MNNRFRGFLTVLALATTLLAAGCTSTRQPQVDPIFTVVPGGRYSCANAGNQRNAFVQAATSTPGQAVAGGALGGLLGNQIGSGAGNALATGAGAAAGAAAGAWNARRMARNRTEQCPQRQAQSK